MRLICAEYPLGVNLPHRSLERPAQLDRQVMGGQGGRAGLAPSLGCCVCSAKWRVTPRMRSQNTRFKSLPRNEFGSQES